MVFGTKMVCFIFLTSNQFDDRKNNLLAIRDVIRKLVKEVKSGRIYKEDFDRF